VHADTTLRCADRDLLSELAARIHSIVAVPVVVIRKEDRRWTIVGEAPSDAPADLVASFATALDRLVAGGPAIRADATEDGRAPWTLVSCTAHPLSVIAIRGDWTLSVAAFASLARNVGRLLEMQTERDRARSGLSAHRLARRLSRARGLREVYEAIVHRMPMAVQARIAALAVPDPSDGRLAIVATHGYPRELVEHLRIDPKSSVFGSVFQSGRVLHVKGFGDSSSSRRRRPRYRTDSFIAIPLVGGHEVLGVICVTDRRDDKPFTTGDVSILRAMAAPAALALGREHALVQAEGFALTAAIDPLSGAFNRRHFHMRLEEELQRSRRHSLSLGFLMIDIDDFKTVNDSFGHLAGDAVIKDVAEILRRSVRVFDVCARFGGEEFAIIMPGSVVESAAMVAERIRERIESYRPSDAGLENVSLTVSIGLAVSSPGMSGHDLIESADRALYLAKRAGKNRVRVATRDDVGDRNPLPLDSHRAESNGPGL
jgi:diguanylate cyclase (GGDEF)-like protein